MTHCLEIKRSWAHQRLIPSTICGILALAHFHSIVWTSPTAYPLTNYVPCVAESIMLAITLLALFLNVLTQLLLENNISRPLFGHTASLMPKWEEDFSIALFRLGAASMEATSVAGFGNEVGSIAVSHPRRDPDKASGTVEIDRAGYVTISPGPGSHGQSAKMKKGFANEISNVKAKTIASAWYWFIIKSMIDVRWPRELGKFLVTAFRWARGVWHLARALVSGQSLSQVAQVPQAGPAEDASRRGEDADSDVYERFLRGDTLSDVDDDEFEPETSQTGPLHDTPLDLSEDDEDDEDPNETVQLFSDLSNDASTSNSTSVLLAHMTDTSSSPLTRRRYSRLIHVGQGATPDYAAEDWDLFVAQRRQVKLPVRNAHDEGLSEGGPTCVVCTVEPRDIICWPCR